VLVALDEAYGLGRLGERFAARPAKEDRESQTDDSDAEYVAAKKEDVSGRRAENGRLTMRSTGRQRK
jgi:hypothetical protein